MTGGSILSLVVSFLAFQIGLVGSQSGKMVSALSLFNCSVFYFAHLSCVRNTIMLPQDHFLVALNRYGRIRLVHLNW